MYITKRINGRVVPNEELGEDLVAMKAQSLRSFFLGGPSSQALTSFVAFVLRTLREEPVVAGVKLSNQSVHSTSSVFDHIGRIYRPNFREKKFFFRENCVPCPPSK